MSKRVKSYLGVKGQDLLHIISFLRALTLGAGNQVSVDEHSCMCMPGIYIVFRLNLLWIPHGCLHRNHQIVMDGHVFAGCQQQRKYWH